MINVPAGARILLATRPIDFRKGAHGLAALAQEVLAENPFSGAVIVYRGKRSDRVKILVWGHQRRASLREASLRGIAARWCWSGSNCSMDRFAGRRSWTG